MPRPTISRSRPTHAPHRAASRCRCRRRPRRRLRWPRWSLAAAWTGAPGSRAHALRDTDAEIDRADSSRWLDCWRDARERADHLQSNRARYTVPIAVASDAYCIRTRTVKGAVSRVVTTAPRPKPTSWPRVASTTPVPAPPPTALPIAAPFLPPAIAPTTAPAPAPAPLLIASFFLVPG